MVVGRWDGPIMVLVFVPPLVLTLGLVAVSVRNEIRRYQPRYAIWRRAVPPRALAGSAWRGVRRGAWITVLWETVVFVALAALA